MTGDGIGCRRCVCDIDLRLEPELPDFHWSCDARRAYSAPTGSFILLRLSANCCDPAKFMQFVHLHLLPQNTPALKHYD